jgi:hypothetical protein
MKKLLSFLLLSTVLTITTFAADNIAKGASVKILEIAKSDSYYEERAELLGKEATALSELVKRFRWFLFRNFRNFRWQNHFLYQCQSISKEQYSKH